MFRFFIVGIMALFVAGCTSERVAKMDAPKVPQVPDGLLQGDYVLNPLFSDEFEGDKIDSKKWFDFYPTWNGRAPGFFDRKNVSVEDGMLVLTARAEDPEKVSPELRVEGKERYSTAAFRSKTRVHYGYFELRFKAMSANVCNAFWLNDPVDPPAKYRSGNTIEEIDIFEVFGKSKTLSPQFKKMHGKDVVNELVYYMTTHWGVTPYIESKVWLGRGHAGFVKELAEPLSKGWHTAGFLWTKEKLVWLLDGKVMKEIKNERFYRPMYLNIDCEIMKGWVGVPADEDLPARYTSDYVRVWQPKK